MAANRWTPTAAERRADTLVHAVSVTAAMVGGFVLPLCLSSQAPERAVCALIVYGFALIASFGCSTAYNLAASGLRKEWLRRFDHAAIFIFIAATFTPILLVPPGSAWRLWPLAALWVLATCGASMKLLAPRRFERIAIIAYLLLGWTGLAAVAPLLATLPWLVLALIVAGGVIYSLGVFVHLAVRLPHHVAIWHCFVLVAASCHYAAIATLAATSV